VGSLLIMPHTIKTTRAKPLTPPLFYIYSPTCRGLPGVHEAVWAASFLSFYLLYPSTFNILEVAAVDKPKVHLWETGVIRITRHPQMWGQLIWCLAHTAWIGSSFMVVTSLGLMAHHAFGCWHGDYRLARKYGEVRLGVACMYCGVVCCT
jgi:uncharacterized membrane protein